MKLLMLIGLPASGKSSYAEELVKGGGNWVRVNRDLLRTMLHFDKWSGKNEDATISAEIAIVIELLNDNINVIIDDTNLSQRHHDLWSGVAKGAGATFETKTFDTDVFECIERDAVRKKKVGAHVVLNMAMQYGLVPGMDSIVVCDIDGTVANGEHRLHHLQGEKKDWKAYFSLMSDDTPRTSIIERVKDTVKVTNSSLIMVSARPEDYREETEVWLKKQGIEYAHLIMRGKNDTRDDTIVKKEILDKYLRKYDIKAVFDDRPRVIRMWQAEGLNVIDVGNGIEF